MPLARPEAGPDQATLVPLQSLGDAREPWTELAERSRNVFSTWEWAETWWRHFGAGKRLRLGAMRHGEETVAVLPMHEQRRRGLRVSRFIGYGVADQLGAVCDPRDTVSATRGLSAMISAGGVLIAERMPSDLQWAGELGGALLGEEVSPVIDLAEERDWDSYLAARSANFRQQARRRARRLQRALGVTFRLTEEPGSLQADFDAMLALHSARWGDGSAAFAGTREAFHREFAAGALERGWLRLWLAEADGDPVAAWYGFRFAGVDSYYQLGRDPAWDRFAVGAGILEHTIREAFADGMREYRLLRGDEQYKRRYATRDTVLCTVAAGRGPMARAAVAAARLLARSESGRRFLRPAGEND
jgi:CelD/BcsL family acetyltransferase involved in cellulose biosynthesis